MLRRIFGREREGEMKQQADADEDNYNKGNEIRDLI